MASIKRLLIVACLMACLELPADCPVETGTFSTEGEIYYVMNKNVPRKTWIDCSEEDMYWFYQCVEAEESGNSYRAKYLAASCIVNRWHQNWQASITEVIFARNQFEVVRNNRIYNVVPSEETIAACNAALDEPEEWVIGFSMGNLHSKYWKLVEVIDGEYYYKSR